MLARWIIERLPVNQNLCALQESSRSVTEKI